MSVLKYDFKDFEDWDKYEHLNIDVDDVEDENLLGEFERSGSWIEKGLKEGRNGKGGGVLVHWYFTQSLLCCNSFQSELLKKPLLVVRSYGVAFRSQIVNNQMSWGSSSPSPSWSPRHCLCVTINWIILIIFPVLWANLDQSQS